MKTLLLTIALIFANDSADFSIQCGETPFTFKAGDAAIAGKWSSGSPLLAQEIIPKAVKVVPIENVRVAVKEGKCPALTEEIAGNECPAGMINYTTPDGRDTCLCYTDKETVEKELDTAATPAAKRIKQLVCHLDSAETGKKEWSVRYVAQNAAVPAGCVVGAQSLLYAVSTGLKSSLVTQLRMLCAPCVVAPKSWGSAPFCLHPDCPGGCAGSCPEPKQEP